MTTNDASTPSIGPHKQDHFSNGAVLRITKRFADSDHDYRYAAVKANGSWWLSGSTTPYGDHDSLSWDELADFCDGATVETMVRWDVLQGAA